MNDSQEMGKAAFTARLVKFDGSEICELSPDDLEKYEGELWDHKRRLVISAKVGGGWFYFEYVRGDKTIDDAAIQHFAQEAARFINDKRSLQEKAS